MKDGTVCEVFFSPCQSDIEKRKKETSASIVDDTIVIPSHLGWLDSLLFILHTKLVDNNSVCD